MNKCAEMYRQRRLLRLQPDSHNIHKKKLNLPIGNTHTYQHTVKPVAALAIQSFPIPPRPQHVSAVASRVSGSKRQII